MLKTSSDTRGAFTLRALHGMFGLRRRPRLARTSATVLGRFFALTIPVLSTPPLPVASPWLAGVVIDEYRLVVHPVGLGGGRAALHHTAHHRADEHDRFQRRSCRPRLFGAPVIEPDRQPEVREGAPNAAAPLLLRAVTLGETMPTSTATHDRRIRTPSGNYGLTTKVGQSRDRERDNIRHGVPSC